MKYRQKSSPVEAVQWFTHGNHPKVEKFKREGVKDTVHCRTCLGWVQKHGWLRVPKEFDWVEGSDEGGVIVCPGDWIIDTHRGVEKIIDKEFKRIYEEDK